MTDRANPPLRILLFANTDWYLYNFRLPLARRLREAGHEVALMSPPGDYADKLSAAGFRWIPFPFSRKGMNPLRELLTLLSLYRLYRRERPHLVHNFTIKCVLYGGIAARAAGVRGIVSAVTGLGHVFTAETTTNRLLRPIVALLYRLALRRSQVIFQNGDDLDQFVAAGLAGQRQCELIRGSGVNTSRFVPVPKSEGPPTVIMVSRLLKEKGVYDLAAAAAQLKKTLPDLQVRLVGSNDPGNPSSVDDAELQRLESEGNVQLLGHRDDVVPLLQTADLAVLPSYYREGTPRSLLEAAACGLPLIATDMPGCREIVRHDDNGLLVPPRDAPALAAAINELLLDAPRRARMGQRSREIACAEFDENLVIPATQTVYAKALAD